MIIQQKTGQLIGKNKQADMKADTYKKRQKQMKSGFSLAELLVTILIMSFVGIIIAGGVSVIRKNLKAADQEANAQIILNTAETMIRNDTAFAKDVNADSNNHIAFVTDNGFAVTFNSNKDDAGGIYRQLYTDIFTDNKSSTSRPASAEKMYLMTKDEMNGNLSTQISNQKFSESTGVFSYKINVNDENGNPVAEQDCSVMLLNWKGAGYAEKK